MKPTKTNISTGLDIGTDSIKIVKLRTIKDTLELCGFDIEPTGAELGQVLKKIKQSQGIDAVNVATCGPYTVIRYINFPKMNQTELRQSLKFEAQKHIPFPVSEINLDGYILKDDLPDNKMLVLIAAVKKEFISQRLKIIEDAGLKVNVVDIDSIALINAFNFNNLRDENLKNRSFALLNIGSSITNLDILENGTPRLSRDIHIAGNNFTQKLMDSFAMDFKSAQELKLNPKLDSPNSEKLIPALESVITNLAQEIRISFDYYESQSTSTVSKIFLSGGASQLRGLKDALANSLGIEVQCWDTLKQINLASTVDTQKAKAVSSQLAVAIGLALRK